MKAISFAQKKVGVFGLGKAGEATVSALLNGGAEVYAWDDKLKERNDIGVLHQQPYEQWPWDYLSDFIPAPGIHHNHPCVQLAKKHLVPVIGDIEVLYRTQQDARYIGITGTNGKSTTTTLIAHLLTYGGVRNEVGGNLGTAALSLAELGAEGTYVLELSSYQLDLVATTRFHVAVLLNLTPDHLDRHGDMEGYMAAKKHIFDRQQSEDVAVIAVDDDYTRAVAAELKASGTQRVIEISCRDKTDGIYVQHGILHDGALRFALNHIASLTGQHNWQNAAAGYAVARAAGIAPDVIYKGLQTFGGLRHRLQLVATHNGVRFINDSKATNADAVQHALAPYKNIYWIAGGQAKSGGIDTLMLLFPHIAHAYLIGDAEDMFAQTLEGKVAYTRCHTLEAATKQAAKDAFAQGREDAVVLLSPACASFDQFKSFEHRGDVFCELVEEIVRG